MVDEDLWLGVRLAAASKGQSMTGWLTNLIERELGDGDFGQGSGAGVDAEGVGAAHKRGRVGDDDPVRGSAGRGVERVPEWAVPIVAVRRDVDSVSGVKTVDPLEEIA